MVSEHVYERDIGTEDAHGPANGSHREWIRYLQKGLRGRALCSVGDVVRGSIACRSGAARHQLHLVSGILQSRSEPSYVCFRPALATVPVGDHQDLHESSPELKATFRTS
jgi:hypothetical protein